MASPRLDQWLVQSGYASTRERAQRMIMAGQVQVNSSTRVKPGQKVLESSEIRVLQPEHPYVSRGGLKLEAALSAFPIRVKGKCALDVGASTGGFSHVLLMHEIAHVIALDVGHSQLDWKIRSDPRVVVMEKVNARYLRFEQIGRCVDLIVIDVSFISLEKILPSLIPVSHLNTQWITLIKPQFEVGQDKVGPGGLVVCPEDHQTVLQRITDCAAILGLQRKGWIPSPILGAKGNQEFLAYWEKDG